MKVKPSLSEFKKMSQQGNLIPVYQEYLADTETDTAMAPLQSAACTYRIALGPRAGQRVITLGALPSFDAPPGW